MLYMKHAFIKFTQQHCELFKDFQWNFVIFFYFIFFKFFISFSVKEKTEQKMFEDFSSVTQMITNFQQILPAVKRA